MAFRIRDPETDRLVRQLATMKGIGLTEAVKLAVAEELRRERQAVPLWERLKPIIESLEKYEDTGLVVDKAFFDDLSGC